MSKLIAVVAIALLLDGVRTVVQPGEEVTGLHSSDAKDLKRMGAVQDEDEVRADQKTAASVEKAAAAEFSKARKTVQAAQAAIEPARA